MRKRRDPNHPTWTEQLTELIESMVGMPPGPERDDAQRRAGQLDSAIKMEGWLKSSELKPPVRPQDSE